jgi:hypothetical protein
MAESKNDAPAFAKGDRVAITAGKKGVGVRGDVFWIGENKYGPGFRYGVKGDDGETYWLDQASVGDEKNAPPPPAGSVSNDEVFDKGDRVRIRAGEHAGVIGAVFWVGPSKFGKGKRYGVKADDDDTYWVDQNQVERSDSSAPEGKASRPREVEAGMSGSEAGEFSDAESFSDDAPPPGDDDYLEDEGLEEGDAGDIPF